MQEATPAPFEFYTSLILPVATGLRAATLPQLSHLLREVPEACVYHHTHYFLLAHQYLTPEPTNDFVYWISNVLGEESLGRRLGEIDTMAFTSLEPLRQALVQTIDDYLAASHLSRLKFASEGEEFFFIKSLHVVMPTGIAASSLSEFVEALQRVSIHSLYFHIFHARLRLSRPTSDFAVWLTRMGEKGLAHEIAALDPYSHTLEALRSMLVGMIRKRLAALAPSGASSQGRS